MPECQLLTDKHYLLIHAPLGSGKPTEGKVDVDSSDESVKELNFLRSNFCGRVVEVKDAKELAITTSTIPKDSIIYLCGDAKSSTLKRYLDIDSKDRYRVKIVKELSYGYVDGDTSSLVSSSEIPLNVHGVGVYVRRQFDRDDYFEKLTKAHEFQSLTESNKPGVSFRKGIYLTPVTFSTSVVAEVAGGEVKDELKSELNFHLLRCSTNLGGPTDSFREIDHRIVDTINETVRDFFDDAAPVNHVLAQVYENKIVPPLPKDDPKSSKRSGTSKERKASIKSHSDKTKDMPDNGVITFTTFYSADVEDRSKSKVDGYDRTYKNQSVLTQLRFRLKNCVTDAPHLPKEFSITLYPNSMFAIPLSTNRLYTHETVPSRLGVAHIPTRLGYVGRCSKRKATFRNGVAYLTTSSSNGGDVPLVKPYPEGVAKLKNLYLQENRTADKIDYDAESFNFSLNDGDYLPPIL